MALSLLRLQESDNKGALPPLSSRRLVLLVLLGVIVFTATALTALRVYPGPYREIDYLVIGTIAVFPALIAIMVGIRISRRKLFIAPEDLS